MKENEIYVLNPYYHLRNDKYRVSLFSKGGSKHLCSTEWHSLIHPLQAWVFCLFTYDRPLSVNLKIMSEKLGISKKQALDWINDFYENPQPVYVNWQGSRICFPKRMLVKAQNDTQYLRLTEGNLHVRYVDLQTQRLFAGPLMITLMLTNKCVTQCEYCYADTSHKLKDPLSTKRIMQIVDQAARLHVRQMNLIGGEVFLHHDWQRILTALVRKKIAPEYLSTKMPLDGEMIDLIKKTGFKGELQVSLDALDDKILSKTIHVKDGYAMRMLDTLHLLDESDIRYHVSSVLTRANCNYKVMYEFWLELAKLKKMIDWRIVPVSNSLYVEYNRMKNIKAAKKQVLGLYNALMPHVRQSLFPVIFAKEVVMNHYRNTSDARFEGEKCSALKTHLFILPDGKVTICEQLYWHPHFIIGDVNTKSLRQVWNSEKAKLLACLKPGDFTDDSACKRCLLFERCIRDGDHCWSNVLKAYGKNHWDYPDPRCYLAPHLTNNIAYK